VSADFLGIGWSTTSHIDRDGGDDGEGALAWASFEESIRQSIIIILSTAPGERQMRPDFGCDIHSLAFAPNSSTTAGRAAFFTEVALKRWEPRIEVLSVKARPDNGRVAAAPPVLPAMALRVGPGSRRQLPNPPPAPDCLLVEIEYQVIATNTIFNLVYPFYLTEGVGS
jgi:phage baseplate assembly protein W